MEFQPQINNNQNYRLLEAQIATGGLIDPHAGHRVPIEEGFTQASSLSKAILRTYNGFLHDAKHIFGP